MWISKLFLIKNDYLLTHLIIEKTDAEAEAPILWPCDVKSWLTGKDSDAGKDWGGEEKDEMVGWHHQLVGHEFEQTPGERKGRGSLACCSPWGYKELDTTERLSWTELKMLRRKLCQVSALRGPGPPILTDSPRAAPYTTPTSSIGFLTTGEICFLQTNGLYPGCV